MAVALRSPAPQFDAVVLEVRKLTQQQIVVEAKRVHAEVMRTPPKPVGFRRRVDGREAPEEAVKPDGVIVYDYNRLDLVAQVALEVLREFSPVLSGLYRDSHRIISQTDTEIRIANTVEYSRVIETAARGGVKLRIQKGGHVYERAARRLRRIPEVGNAANIEFGYTEAFGPAHHRDRAAMRSARWPTLILRAL